MSSKLDYLKKYGSSGEGDVKKKRRKKGAKPGKSTTNAVGLRIVDEEVHELKLDQKRVDKAWEDPEEEDEKPTVVLPEQKAQKVQTGTWSSVPEDHPSPTRCPHEDGDQSPPRRRRPRGSSAEPDDSSPPRRSRKHDSPSGDADPSPPRRRRRHDSPVDDLSPARRVGRGEGRSGWGNGQEDASPPRRNRGGNRRDNLKSEDASPSHRSKAGQGRRHGSLDSTRKRHDSPRGDNDSPSRKQRRRQDYSEAGGEGEGERWGGGGGDDSTRRKTASGYFAGLQSGKDFKAVEQELRRKHDAEMAGADPSTSGAGAETVYRDKKGRKLDMLNEFMRQQEARAGKQIRQEVEQREWGRGKVQKEQEKQFQNEVANIAQEPFARTVDDPRLEKARKEEIRADDPMAAYVTKKRANESAKSGRPVKQVYKGPPPKPNRFGVKPGYRWDGVDRGNGWEQKLVAKHSDRLRQADLAYQWASADM